MFRQFAIALAFMAIAVAVVKAETQGGPAAAVEQMFAAIDASNYERKQLAAHVTPDFRIFEVGQVFDLDGFDDLLRSGARSFESMTWSLSDFVVTQSGTLAHVAYRNDGRFVDPGGKVLVSHWLESALLVMVDEEWKVKFLQSDLVARELRHIDGSVEVIYPASGK